MKTFREYRLFTVTGEIVPGILGARFQWCENPNAPREQRRLAKASEKMGEPCEWRFVRELECADI